MRLKQLGERVEQGLHVASGALNWIGAIVLFAMVLLVTADVTGRYVLNRPVTGSNDFIVLMMIVVVFCGLAYCATLDRHVRVDVIYGWLPRRIQENLDSVTSAISTLILGLITWQVGVRVWRIVVDPPGPLTQTWLIPFLPFICLAAVGSLLLSLELLTEFFHSLTRRR
jgi:TRAP-type C4-dicarboxylate transport system permease small subunit